MRSRLFAAALLALCACAHANEVAPTGTLRAAYIGGNPAQAVQDKASGAIRGVVPDLSRELARRLGVPVEIKPAANPQGVIEAVSGGAADIGFIAYEPSRAGPIEFSQTYVLVQQSFLVLEGSAIRALDEIDRDGLRIAGTRNDSITLFLKRKLKRATLVELENNPAETKRMLLAKEIDAFGSNRQRLSTFLKDTPGTRVLPGSLFGVPQTIIVPKGRSAALETINRFLDDARASGFLQQAVAASGATGIEPAPGGSWLPSVPD